MDGRERKKGREKERDKRGRQGKVGREFKGETGIRKREEESGRGERREGREIAPIPSCKSRRL